MLTEQVPTKDRARVKAVAAEAANRAAAVKAVRLGDPDAEPDRVGNKVRGPDAEDSKAKKEAAPEEVESLYVNMNEESVWVYGYDGEENTMPRGNGTGPTGMGPMTGRKGGYCAGYGMPGYADSAQRIGAGLGAGRMRGWRRGCGPGFGGTVPFTVPFKADEKQFLQGQAEILQKRLNEIKGRLDELGA